MGKKKAPNAQWGKRKRQTHNEDKQSVKRTIRQKRECETHNKENESVKRTMKTKVCKP